MDGTAEVSLYDEATALPFARVVALPVHPGLEVAGGVTLAAGSAGRLEARAHLGGLHHAHLADTFTADVGLAAAAAPAWGGFAGAELGLGAALSVAPGGEYALEGGEYRSVGPAPHLAARPSFALELGGHTRGGVEVALRYRAWVEAPFAPGFIPVMVHGDTGLVLRLPWRS